MDIVKIIYAVALAVAIAAFVFAIKNFIKVRRNNAR